MFRARARTRSSPSAPMSATWSRPGPEHPLRFVDEDETGGLKPYVLVRGRLEALVARPVMYELVEHGEEIEIGGATMFAVRSKGEVYPIMPADRAEAAECADGSASPPRRSRPRIFACAQQRETGPHAGTTTMATTGSTPSIRELIVARRPARRGRADPGRRSRRRGNRAPDQAHREAAQPFGPGGLSRRAHRSRPTLRRRTRRCARQRRRSASAPTTSRSSAACRTMSPGSGYRIAPVLGIVSRASISTINEHEVDAVFEVPLRFLMDPANHGRDSRIWGERERFFYDMPYGEQRIWGVTAGIIRTLYERLYRVSGGFDRRPRRLAERARPAATARPCWPRAARRRASPAERCATRCSARRSPTSTSPRRTCLRKPCAAPRRQASRRCRPASSMARSRSIAGRQAVSR